MNKRIKELIIKAGFPKFDEMYVVTDGKELERFAKLIVESVLDEVNERAYYSGYIAWSNEEDRHWIQLEFGYGSLHEAKKLRNTR
jgi:hypothetical protein